MENQNNGQQAQQTQNPPQAAAQQNLQPQLRPAPTENIVDNTLRRVTEMQRLNQIQLPTSYSVGNALKAAWLLLQDVKNRSDVPALTCCTPDSIAYSLLSMVVQGLNPMKRQCSFIVYGNKLTLQREYQGSIAVAKRYGLKEVTANAIFKGDVFKYEVDAATGRKKIITHEQSFENLGGEVVGAYAIIEMADGTKDVEVMSIAQIKQAWKQGATKGTSPAHVNFPDQMACKTVIGRAMKPIINSSDDAALFDDEAPATDVTSADVQHRIEANANRTEVGFINEDTGELTDKPTEGAHPISGTIVADPEPAKESATAQTQSEPQKAGPGF